MNSPFMGDFIVTQPYKHGQHDGLDLVGITHKDIHAVTNGTVIFAGWENGNDHSQGFGQYVAIKNGDDVWYYGHLSKINVRVGDTVKITDIIGTEGSTGYSTGSHVHICVRAKGVYGMDKDVSAILGIPNTAGNTKYNDGYETAAINTITNDIEIIKTIQNYLNSTYSAGLDVDGICGKNTYSAIKKYLFK